MIWNRVSNATHFGLDVLSVGVYDAIEHFNIGGKGALDIMELLKIDPDYYMTMCCRSYNMRRKRSSIYRIWELQKKCRKILLHSKKRQQEKNTETEGTSHEKVVFETQY